MKSRIIVFLLSIISIIVAFGVILYIKNDKTVDFPHYKQAYYKMSGSMNVIKDTAFDLPLIFIDANEMSEMSSSENIKSIDIYDGNSQKLNVQKWHIEENLKGTSYVIRTIQAEVIMNEEGTFKPEKFSITYKDNVTKKYDFGDFNIICKSDDYYSDNLAAGIICDINPVVTAQNKDGFPYSGLSLFIKGNTEEFKVDKINLGINEFGIEKDNLVCFQTEDDLNVIMNYVRDGLSKNEPWAENLSRINLVDSVSNDINPFTVEVPSENHGTNILVPLTRLKNVSMNQVMIFNIDITLNIEGQEKHFIKFQPYYVTPFTFNQSGMYQYLEEAGI